MDECRRLGVPKERVTLLGKVIVLDLETGKRRQAHAYLPEALKGNPADPELTLFLVAEKHKTQVASYSPTETDSDKKAIPGYRVDLDVAIVRWPSKKPIGMVRLKGEDPPKSISVLQWTSQKTFPDFVTGAIDAPMSSWVESRPTAGKPDPVGDALALAPKEEGKGAIIKVRCLRKDESYVYAEIGSAPKRKGKVLIWDVTRDRHAGKANRYLTEALRGQATDKELTLVMVTRQTVEADKSEALKGFVTGKATIEGYIVHWPDKKLIGTFELTADDLLGVPKEGFFQNDGQVASDPETGLNDTAALKLARWIKSLVGS
ncbi:MAG: hypothetical protein K8T89_24740 [Planctomycetes bacterium]|nr:hypothetical protein [Planctomycetota bacterium]